MLHTLKKLEKEGFEIELLDVHSNGIVSAKQVEDAIREDTLLKTEPKREEREQVQRIFLVLLVW